MATSAKIPPQASQAHEIARQMSDGLNYQKVNIAQAKQLATLLTKLSAIYKGDENMAQSAQAAQTILRGVNGPTMRKPGGWAQIARENVDAYGRYLHFILSDLQNLLQGHVLPPAKTAQIIKAANAEGLKANASLVGDIDSLLRSVVSFKVNESQLLMQHCRQYADQIKPKSPQAARQLIIAKQAIYDLMNAQISGDGQRRWKYYTQAMDALKQARQLADQSVDKSAKAARTAATDIEGLERSVGAAGLRWGRLGNAATWSKEVQPYLHQWRQTWDGLKARYPKLNQLDAHFVDEALNGWKPTDDPQQGVRGLKQALSTVVGQAEEFDV